MRLDKGLYGEYLTFNKLSGVDAFSKILTNVYLPKGQSETTELDLVFIHEKGLYVIESKNYNGWIYGKESARNWTQTFKNGKKFKFYNPIKQNKTHIKYLKESLADIYAHDVYSLIVFSERCTLKKIDYTSQNLKVLKRSFLKTFIKRDLSKKSILLTEDEVTNIYQYLSQYSRVSDETKNSHVNRIKSV